MNLKRFDRMFLVLGLFVTALLGTGCGSRMEMDSKMEEIAGEYVLVPTHEMLRIPQEDFDAKKVASIRKSGDEWVLEYSCPVFSYPDGGFVYFFHRFSQRIYYNQVRGTYIVSPLSEEDVRGTGLRILELEPVKISSRELTVGRFTWNKQ